ncbi:hypothetical protein J2X46_003116 [Nocardioides sp. BE266]|nr:hypothetical protein [Nocardioides sp. BE266]
MKFAVRSRPAFALPGVHGPAAPERACLPERQVRG